MKRLEVSGAVRPIYGSLRVKRLIFKFFFFTFIILYNDQPMHNYVTNYYTTPTCVDTIVSSSGSSYWPAVYITGPAQQQHQHTDCVYGHHTGLHEKCNNKMILVILL